MPRCLERHRGEILAAPRSALGPGIDASRVIRFTTPLSLPAYDSVNVLKITTDSEEALH